MLASSKNGPLCGTPPGRVSHARSPAVRQWAHILGKNEPAAILDQTIKEEGHAAHLLTEIASRINVGVDKAA
jgi:ferritin-like metal-binding protein YciE